jgi:hypothetical protein
MNDLFIAFYGLNVCIAVGSVWVRRLHQVPLWRSVAVSAVIVCMMLCGLLLSNNRPGPAFTVLGLGYAVAAYSVLHFFITGTFLDVPKPTDVQQWFRPPTLSSQVVRPTMYQRVVYLSPQELRRALCMVRDPELRMQIEALLLVYKQGKHLRLVA